MEALPQFYFYFYLFSFPVGQNFNVLSCAMVAYTHSLKATSCDMNAIYNHYTKNMEYDDA